MPGPLDGIRVFDLTMAQVGPWSTQNLGALGADVMHIEQGGVDESGLGGAQTIMSMRGMSPLYIGWNMNKRGLFLDLKSQDGQEFAHRLLATCDVFVNNMRPGVPDRLGVGYEAVAAINPRIVYCTITGWGESGPMAPMQGADTQIQYYSGWASLNGPEGQLSEVYRHFSTLDGTTGNYATQAILLALVARERTGRGQKIEINMLHALAAFQTSRLGSYALTGEVPMPSGSAAIATAPDEAFQCADGRWLGVSVTSEDEWRRFCDAVKRPDLLEDAAYATNILRVAHRHELSATLAATFAEFPLQAWVNRFRHADVAWGAPLWFSELRHHEQVRANNALIEIETPWGEVTTGGPPWRFSDTPARWTRPPIPGEHTGEVMDEVERATAGNTEAVR